MALWSVPLGGQGRFTWCKASAAERGAEEARCWASSKASEELRRHLLGRLRCVVHEMIEMFDGILMFSV